MIITSWTFFYSLIFVLALWWGSIEMFQWGYRTGWRESQWSKELGIRETLAHMHWFDTQP